MSHYCTIVITGDADSDDNVATLMEPYSENIDVAPYVTMPYADVRKEVDTKVRHIYHKLINDNGRTIVHGVKKLYVLDDDIVVDKMIDTALYDADNGKHDRIADIWHDWASESLDNNGNAISTYNQDARWDYWTPIEHCIVSELDDDDVESAFAVVTPDRKWHSNGRVGWFAQVYDDDENSDFNVRAILGEYMDSHCVVCDCHI